MLWVYLIFTLSWAAVLVNGAYSLQSVRKFVPTRRNFRRPAVSLIIAVKDDGTEIGPTLERLSQLTYAPLEVIVVVDRSTDQTEDVVREWLARDPRMKMAVVRELPTGWIGKVNALRVGAAMATGEFMLFQDASMAVDDGTLDEALWTCEAERLDHFTIVPRVRQQTFWTDAMMSNFTILLVGSFRPWLAPEKRPLSCIKGCGVFNLVRRSVWLQTPGFEWFKMDISDDMAIAQLVARAGGRSLMVLGTDQGPHFAWYRNLRQVARGMEKNIVAGLTNYSLPLTIVLPLLAGLPFLLPVCGLFFPTESWPFRLSLLTLLFNALFAWRVRRFVGLTWAAVFAAPGAFVILGFVLWRAGAILWYRGGVTWSGTFYPLDQLRAGNRVKLWPR